jgi:hypothetical protein
MKLKIFLARLIHKRLEHEARRHRRALRDHLRQEVSRIRQLEIRSRALRLYAAWAANGTSRFIHTHGQNWPERGFSHAGPQIEAKTRAIA